MPTARRRPMPYPRPPDVDATAPTPSSLPRSDAPGAAPADALGDEGGVIQGLGILAILVIATGAAGYLVSGSAVPWVLVSAISPYLLAVSVPVTVVLASTKHWQLVPFTAAGLVMLLVTQVPAFVADPAQAGQTVSLNVMTVNIHVGQGDPRAVVAEVRDRHIDALMVQELTPYARLRLANAGLDALLPHEIVKPSGDAGGTGLWSRFPLEEVDWPPMFFLRVAARVAMPGATTPPTLVALHVPGPTPDSALWKTELQQLPDKLASLPGDAPVVVGGDFNASHAIPRFRALLRNGYADATDQAGAGVLPTYPSDRWFPPVLDIDHVLTRDAVGRSADTVTIPGSDHRALVVRVAMGDTR